MNLRKTGKLILLTLLCSLWCMTSAFARDIDYKEEEVSIYVTPGEPTQIEMPGRIASGFMPSDGAVNLDKKENHLFVFATPQLNSRGVAMIVQLEDGRSYSLRIRATSSAHPRDAIIRIQDKHRTVVGAGAPCTEDNPDCQAFDPKFKTAPANSVSGLMREMVLVNEFGKNGIPGYRVSDRYRGETVLNDGTISAKIDQIFIGPNLWGYVIDAENLISQSQKINPATFRLNGTRAVSLQRWELEATPVNVEQQIAGRHKTKVYVITRAKNN